ncbi:uncharacterized protein BJX67DRAFT_365229 [Aspergillus lucknowensis]|uniref:Uncharacterized protein n=1 Tax=Aspergillus lucknowensis TaxID=176173 RepID=A0ABR4LEF9_9EURO
MSHPGLPGHGLVVVVDSLFARISRFWTMTLVFAFLSPFFLVQRIPPLPIICWGFVSDKSSLVEVLGAGGVIKAFPCEKEGKEREEMYVMETRPRQAQEKSDRKGKLSGVQE